MAKRWKPPSKIKIGHATYTCVPRPQLFNNKGEELYGRINYGSRIIEYTQDPSIHSDQLKDVIFHEALHGIWNNYNLNKEASREEDVILAFEAGIKALFMDNPKLVEVLK